MARIVHAFASINLALRCEPWFEYVRSKANIADVPSRGDFALLRSLGAVYHKLVLPPLSAWDETVGYWMHLASLAAASGSGSTSGRHKPHPPEEEPLRSRRRKYYASKRSHHSGFKPDRARGHPSPEDRGGWLA